VHGLKSEHLERMDESVVRDCVERMNYAVEMKEGLVVLSFFQGKLHLSFLDDSNSSFDFKEKSMFYLSCFEEEKR